MHFVAETAAQVLPVMAAHLIMDGDEVGSRQGLRTKELLYAHTELTQPWRREVNIPSRKCSIAAQVAETMWVLSGRNDVEFLGHYLSRAEQFSDDGKTWRGGYGPRLRSFGVLEDGGIDQLEHVVELLRRDPTTRQAVMAIYDPVIDTQPGKDIPCNDFITFQNRLGKLHMGVTIRSNDLIWGWSGINAFEWSALQEIVAALVGVEMGHLHFYQSSLHVYENHWDKAYRIANDTPTITAAGSPRFAPLGRGFTRLQVLFQYWFELEKRIRSGDPAEVPVDSFPEPMLQSWLRVLQWHWTGDIRYLDPLRGTDLQMAAFLSPTKTGA